MAFDASSRNRWRWIDQSRGLLAQMNSEIRAGRHGERDANRGWCLRRDLPAFAFVVAAIVGMMLYRRYGVEPRGWAAACIARSPPVGCLPRMAVVWLQGEGLWGWAALALGFAAFIFRRLSLVIAALVLGGAAVVNFNASLGMCGAALGAWTWLRLPPVAPPWRGETREPVPPEPAPPRSRSGPGD